MLRIASKISSKGQVTIPVKVRQILGVNTEDRINFVVDEQGRVGLEPVHEFTLDELEGILPALDRPTSPDFREEIREAMEERAEQLVDRLNQR
jgi:AbrB family looped-hinge helix DNA binding protein